MSSVLGGITGCISFVAAIITILQLTGFFGMYIPDKAEWFRYV